MFRVDGKIIPAYKLLLAAKSPVFNAMFCGELAEQDHVNLPDCEYEGMLEFLCFLYTEEVNLSWHERDASFVSGREVHGSQPHQKMQHLFEFKLRYIKCVFHLGARGFIFK